MARRAPVWWRGPPPRLAGLGIGDVLAAMEASASCGPDALWRGGTRAMERYRICDGPAGADGVDVDGYFVARVKEIAREDGSYWRAIPQAVHEWSRGRAIAREAGLATAVYAMGRRGLSSRVTRDVDAAAAAAARDAGRRGGDRGRARPAPKARAAGAGGPRAGALTQEDIMATLDSSGGHIQSREETLAKGAAALARYGISCRIRGRADRERAGFDRRVDEIAREDGGHWRAIPQAIHERSGGRATFLELDAATAVYMHYRGNRGLANRAFCDMSVASMSAKRRLYRRRRRRAGAARKGRAPAARAARRARPAGRRGRAPARRLTARAK